MRLAAEIVRLSVASNKGARPRGRLGLGDLGEASRSGRRGIDMLRARNGSGDAAEALRHGDVHRDDRDAAVDIRLLGELAADVSARSAVAATTLFETTCACLPVTRIEPGKPAAGSSRTSPVAEIDPPSGVTPLSRSMRIVSPLATSTPVIPVSLNPVWSSRNSPFASRTDPCACGFGDGPAQLKRERERAGHPAAGKRQGVVGEPGVEPAVELEIERAVARQRRRAGEANRIGAARIGRDVDRCPPSREPARTRDVERR